MSTPFAGGFFDPAVKIPRVELGSREDGGCWSRVVA